jgi:hypothetical protein
MFKLKLKKRSRNKIGDLLYCHYGRCVLVEGMSDVLMCYACEGEARAWPWLERSIPLAYGIVRIELRGQHRLDAPLCQACLASRRGGADGRIARKFWNYH